MKNFQLSIVRDKGAWKVGEEGSWDGPYATLAEAIDVAVHAVSVLHEAGHTATISVPHRRDGIELTLTASEGQASRSAA